MNEHKKKSINFWLLAFFFGLLLGSLSFGSIFTWRTNGLVEIKNKEARETKRPAKIEAIVLNDKNCADCFDISPLFGALEKENVKIESKRDVERTSDEGKNLIEKYAIIKLPTVILRGELEKEKKVKDFLATLGEIKDGVFILRRVGGPYVVPSSGEIKGRTELILIADKTCEKCYDVLQHKLILNRFGVYPKITAVDVGAEEGKKYIKQFGITLVPTFVLMGDVKEFPDLIGIWPQVGIEKNKAYVFTKGVAEMGIFKDLKSNKIIEPNAVKK